MMGDELEDATKLKTFLNFEGYLKYSPLFYGWVGTAKVVENLFFLSFIHIVSVPH